MIGLSLLVFAFIVVFRNYIRRLLFKSAIDNIPGPDAISFWKGSFNQLFDPDGWKFHKEIAEKYGRVIKIQTFLGKNWLYVYDPKALHHIVVKEAQVFEESSEFIETNKLVFGPGLVATLGDQHRKQRKMLMPVFSIAHMRDMIPIFYRVSNTLRDTFSKKVASGAQEVDILHWMGRTALELIGQSGLGWSFDDLVDDEAIGSYSVSVKKFVPVSHKFAFARTYFLSTLVRLGSPKFRRWVVDHLPGENVRELKNIIDVLHNKSVEIIESKKKAIAKGDEAALIQIGGGKDIMSILLKANTEAAEGERMTDEEVLGQMSTLTFAAMDTTSSALSRTLHLLAQHPAVQEKLRQEILEAKGDLDGELSYDQLVSLPYLDAICRETLRVYPPLPMINRTTRQDAVIPLSEPIRGLDGKEIHEIPVPNNTTIVIGILASNRNPEIWGEDAHEWKPERWLEPLPKSVSEARIPGVYSNLMTFLGGGRSCIGFKFSQLEMKVVLVTLIESFRFSLSKKEISWKMLDIVSPVLKHGGEKNTRQLPLIVERIR